MVKRILPLTVICAVICSAPALTFTKDDEPAEQAALQWLRVVDSGNYKDAALLIADHARGSQDWLKYFAAHRAPLGRLNKRQLIEVKHASTIPSDPVLRPHAIMRFKTSFERKAIAIEEVVVTKMGCCWEIFGYTIRDR